MRGAHVVVLSLSLVSLPRSCSPAPPSVPDGETSHTWFLSGGGRDVYTLEEDAAVLLDGFPTTALHASGPTDDAYGTAMVTFDAAPYLGKRLRLSAPVRTEGVTARGDFWVRAQAPWSPSDGKGLGGGRQALEPTADFASYVVDFRVSPAATRIEIGVGIAGPGRLWVGPASWEVLPDAEGDSAVGVWNVTWDRSGTGVELGSTTDPTHRSVLEGVVDGDVLTGTMSTSGSRGSAPPCQPTSDRRRAVG